MMMTKQKWILAATLCMGLMNLPIANSVTPAELYGAHYEDPVDPSELDKPTTLKILLKKEAPQVRIETCGKFDVFNPKTGKLVRGKRSNKAAVMKPILQGLSWPDAYGEVFQMRFVPKERTSYLVVDGKQYRGCLEVFNICGKLMVVNEIDIENYLRSTLPEKVRMPLTQDAMDALVIVERTAAYYAASKNLDRPFQLTAEEVNFQGHSTSGQNPMLDRAIDLTFQMVLTNDGIPFPTGWTEDSAGKTASYAAIYRKNAPGPSGVVAPIAERDREAHTWNGKTGKIALATIANLPEVKEIELFKDHDSDKVYAVRLASDTASRELTLPELQKALPFIASTDFDVKLGNDEVQFTGHGKGLGIGLCLYTAEEMAKKGKSSKDILKTFYPTCELKKSRKPIPLKK